MDMITELFIKMCEMDKEIQRVWKPVDWDIFAYKYSRGLGMGWEVIGVKDRQQYIKENCIWLPTQEQLQSILQSWCEQEYKSHLTGLSNGDSINLYMVENVAKFADNNWQYLPDINMLWLGFLMCQLYNKRWTGKDWKTIEGGK